MKFTFICIVIVISCSVCACNDLDIYSGLNFDFDRPKDVSSLPDYDSPNYYQKFRYPYENVPMEDYDDTKIRELPDYDANSEKMRQYQKVIDWQMSQYQHRPHHQQHHVSPRLKYILGKLTKHENFDLDIPNMPLIEDPRMYPSDEDASRLRFDDNKEEDGFRRPRLFDDPLFGSQYGDLETNDVTSERNRESSSHDMHHAVHPNNKDTKEFTTDRFSNVKVADNPSEFAYPPSDSRFYRGVEIPTEQLSDTTKVERPMRLNAPLNIIPAEKLEVNIRSDHVTSGGSEDRSSSQEDRKDGIEVVSIRPGIADGDSAGVYVIAIVAGISAAATVGLIAVGIGWYNLQKHVKNASDVEYPAYGVTGPNKDMSPSGDRRLAQSAQMYHYQHQKQQIIAMERAPPGERHGSVSEAESDEENEEGDYTVYECPGLAPTGEMEVKNPMFQDDATPAQTPAPKTSDEEKK